jgi:hypothetical protein
LVDLFFYLLYKLFFVLFPYSKILVVFGGLAGLEAAVKADQSIEQSDPADYFPNYVNWYKYKA